MVSSTTTPEFTRSMSSDTEPSQQLTEDNKSLARRGAIRHRRMASAIVGKPLSAPQTPVFPLEFARSMSSEAEPSEQQTEENKSKSLENTPLVRRGAIRHRRMVSAIVGRPFSAPQSPVLTTPGRLKISPLRIIQYDQCTNVRAEPTGQEESPFDHFMKSWPLAFACSTRLFSFKAKDIAAELTLIDAEMFRCIAPSELKNGAWTKSDTKYTSSPNIMRMIAWFNRLARIACTEIVQEKTPYARGKAISSYIKIASECYKLRNYNSLKAILSALQLQAIYRLEKSWQNVPRSMKTKFDRLMSLMSEENRFENLRYAMEKNMASKEHFLPYLAWFLNSVLTENTYTKIRQDREKFEQRKDFIIKEPSLNESSQICTQEKSAAPSDHVFQTDVSSKGGINKSLPNVDQSTDSRRGSPLQHSPTISLFSHTSEVLVSKVAADDTALCSVAVEHASSSDEYICTELAGSSDDSDNEEKEDEEMEEEQEEEEEEEEKTNVSVEIDIHDLHSVDDAALQPTAFGEENPLKIAGGRIEQAADLEHIAFHTIKSFKTRHVPLRRLSPAFAFKRSLIGLSLPPDPLAFEFHDEEKKQEDKSTKCLTYHFPECGIVFSVVPANGVRNSSILQSSPRIEMTQWNTEKVQLQEAKAMGESDEYSTSLSFSSSSSEINNDGEVFQSSSKEKDDDKASDSLSSHSTDDDDDDDDCISNIQQMPLEKETLTVARRRTRSASTPGPNVMLFMTRSPIAVHRQRQGRGSLSATSTEASLELYQMWTLWYMKKYSRHNKIRTLLYSTSWLSESKCLDISAQIEPHTRS